MGRVVGLSFSTCVAAICRGDVSVDEIPAIYSTGTIRDIEICIRKAQDHEWIEFPDKAADIARSLFQQGKVIYPSNPNTDLFSYNHGGRVWLDIDEASQFVFEDKTRHNSTKSLTNGVDKILEHARQIIGSVGILRDENQHPEVVISGPIKKS